MDCRCTHWTDCGVSGGGCCGLKLYGGRPSFGTCMQCNKNDSEVEINFPEAARGLMGSAKSYIGIGIAKQDEILARLSKCLECPHRFQKKTMDLKFCGSKVHSVSEFGFCGLCGCNIQHKTRVRNSECPDQRW